MVSLIMTSIIGDSDGNRRMIPQRVKKLRHSGAAVRSRISRSNPHFKSCSSLFRFRIPSVPAPKKRPRVSSDDSAAAIRNLVTVSRQQNAHQRFYGPRSQCRRSVTILIHVRQTLATREEKEEAREYKCLEISIKRSAVVNA